MVHLRAGGRRDQGGGRPGDTHPPARMTAGGTAAPGPARARVRPLPPLGRDPPEGGTRRGTGRGGSGRRREPASSGWEEAVGARGGRGSADRIGPAERPEARASGRVDGRVAPG